MRRLLLRDNVKMAMMSLRVSRWRSMLTMLGVIIGVASVVTVVGIGEGVKRQVASQIDQLGSNVLTIRPGQPGSASFAGRLQGSPTAVSSFTANDLRAVGTSEGVRTAVPFGHIASSVKVDGKERSDAFVIASSQDMPQVFSQRIAYGEFFGADSMNDNVAVIGRTVAENIFGQEVPLGRSFTLLGERFVVQGIFDSFDEAPISFTVNMNNAIVVPYERAQTLTKDTLQTYQILALADEAKPLKQVQNAISKNLSEAHGGQRSFVVERQDQVLAATHDVLDVLTVAIAAIAAISLLVGGVGIMNVMLVSVAERMHEIGIRKAIGATSRQILSQFLIEATIVSLVGGIIGVFIALLVTVSINIFTDFHAVVNWTVALLAIAVSAAVGIVFGTAPAAKAARKDPIQALRYE